MQLDNPVLIGVYIASITAITSVITNLITTLVSNYSQNRRESKNWVRSELRGIYGDCIKSLSTLLTLSGMVESNLDFIEQSVVESKKYLALALIYVNRKQIKSFSAFKEDVHLFTSGEYEKLLNEARMRGIEPISRYQNVIALYGAADVMLRQIIEIASRDERLF